MFDDKVEIPFLRVALAEGIHLGKFLAGIDVHDRKRHTAEEGFMSEPDHHVGILAERPQQRNLFKPGKGFAQDENALRFEVIKTVHRGHSIFDPGASRTRSPLVSGETRIWQQRRDVSSTANASSRRSTSSSVGGWRRGSHASST